MVPGWWWRGAEDGLLKTQRRDLALSSSSSQAYALEPGAFFVLPPLASPCAYCNLAFRSIYRHGDKMSHLQSREDNGRRGTVHDGSVLDSLAVELTFSHCAPGNASGTPKRSNYEASPNALSTQGFFFLQAQGSNPQGQPTNRAPQSFPLFQALAHPEPHVHSPILSS